MSSWQTVPETFVDRLKANALQFPDRSAIISLADDWGGGVGLTYAELDASAAALGAALARRAAPGERVLLLLPSGLDYVKSFLGCLYAGLIAVPAFPPDRAARTHLGRLDGIMRDAAPRLILAPTALLPQVAELAGRLVAEILTVDSLAQEAAAPAAGEPGLGPSIGPSIGPQTVAFLQYTSGSTSAPKGVMVTHRNLVANEMAIRTAFEIDRSDVVVSWLPLFHDMGLVGGLLQPLFSGGQMVLLSPRQFLERPVRWLEAVSRYGGTVSGGPDFAFRLCAERIPEAALAGLDLSRWQLAFCGAEPIRPDTMTAFAARCAAVGFRAEAAFACYGLAEATLFATGGRKGAGFGRDDSRGTTLISCGTPRPGHAVRIVDAEGRETAGVGEIWLCGPSISPGYWNKPEETAQTFVTADGTRFLRTGDLGYVHDGEVFVAGRCKDLIIVRGQNIYPQDVEALIETEIDAIRPGRVAAFRTEAAGEEGVGIAAEVSRTMQRLIPADALARLIAETVAGGFLEPPKLVLLLPPGTLPKTSSGKLRRSVCLPLWRAGALAAYAAFELGGAQALRPAMPDDIPDDTPAATSALVEAVRIAVRDSLGRPDLGDADSFFLAGGNSITAVQATARLAVQLKVEIPVHLLFENPTIAGFAAALEHRFAQETQPPRAAPARLGHVEGRLSPAQERMWFMWRAAPRSAAYLVAGAVRLVGPLDVDALERALAWLTDRHEILRTTFFEGPDGVARQRVRATGAVAMERVGRAALEAFEPFDLEAGPPWRARLAVDGGGGHVLCLVLHHIITDGWSMPLLFDELMAAYEAFASGGSPDRPAPALQYLDIAAFQRAALESAETARQLRYWTERLGFEHPVLELPADGSGATGRQGHGVSHRMVVPPALAARLKELAHDQNATVFMVLLAAFKVLLHRLGGGAEVRVAVPTAGRTRAEFEGLLGLFVNTQVLTARLDGAQSFAALLGEVRAAVAQAQSHQDLPFDRLVEALQSQRGGVRHPLAQVMLNHRRRSAAERAGCRAGLEVTPLDLPPAGAQFDLALDVLEDDDTFACTFTGAEEVFSRPGLGRLAGRWLRLLEAVADASATRVAALPLLDEEEWRRVTADWARGPVVAQEPACLHELVARSAARTPAADAVVAQGGRLSYAALEARAGQLARHLRARGVGPDTTVGVAMTRGLDLPVALLAILKAGGAYVPLDPDYPAERLARMAADSGLRIILTQADMVERLEFARTLDCICLDRDAALLASEPGEARRADEAAPAPRPENLAYCIFTSGSTGRPKGADNSHGAIVNRLAWMQAAYDIGPADRILHKTPFSFDVSVWELFLPLICGGTLVMAPPGAHREPARLAALIRQHGVTALHFVPSMLDAFLAETVGPLPSLRHVFSSGEALPGATAQAFLTRFGARLHNLYGPTEAAVDVSFWLCRGAEDGRVVPIGRPIWNTELVILDGDLSPVPPGVVGQLYIGGAALARGYHGRSGLTAERFVPHPLARRPGARLYRTGDLARWRADGGIDYVGRIDHQVKIRGLRIELGEIEAQLMALPQVRTAAVVARDLGAGAQLVAYMVPEGAAGGDLEAEAKAHLARVLPDFMVPAHVVRLDHLPLSPNGKLDRQALPRPQPAAAGVTPSGPVEEALAAIFREVLKRDDVGVSDNFFALGGDSILSLRILARARQAGLKLSPAQMFAHPTIAALARVAQPLPPEVPAPLEERLADLSPSRRETLALTLGEIEDAYPLSPMQQGMLFHALHEPGSGHYVNQLALTVAGLDIPRLHASWRALLARHGVLRTTFVWDDDGPPLQVVARAAGPERADAFTVVAAQAGVDAEAQAAAYAAAERARGFDLAAGPLQRLAVLPLGDGRARIVFTHHHLLTDGWSTVRELEELFATYLGEPAPAPPPPYRAYIAWLQRRDAAAAEPFFTSRLAALDAPTLLAAARGVKPQAVTEGEEPHGRIAHRLAPERVARLQAFAVGEGITLNTLIQGAWALLLGRWCGVESVCFGATTAGRPADLGGSEDILGLFINTLPVVVGLAPEARVGDWLRALQAENLALREHEHVPLYDIQRWAGRAGQGLFDTLLVFENYPVDAALRRRCGAALSFEAIEARNPNTFAFTLNVDVAEGLDLSFVHARAAIGADAAARIAARFIALVNALAADGGRALGEIGLCAEAEIAGLVEQWGHGPQLPEGPATLDGLIAASAHHEAVALVHEETVLSFGALQHRAEALAVLLRRLGVAADAPVGLATGRTPALVVGLLGIVKAQGAYVPLDPDAPPERLRGLLAETGIGVVVAEGAAASLAPFAGCIRVRLEEDGTLAVPEPAVPLAAPGPVMGAAEADQLAYVIFTSGSTGRPKGVGVSHRAITTYVRAMAARLADLDICAMALISTPSADLGHTVLFGALARGATLHLISAERAFDADRLASYMAGHAIDVLKIAPSHLAGLLAARGGGDLLPRRALILGGEASEPQLLAQVRRERPECRIFNHYGPTESCVGVLVHELTPQEPGGPPLGRPLAGSTVLLLDAALQPVPVGVVGEIHVGGPQLARGYLGRAGATAERFVPHPFARRPGERLYRTGDRALWRADGTLEYVGRSDAQVKIRGFRVEPGEVEAALLAQPFVRAAAVVAREGAAGRRLVAYVVLTPQAGANARDELMAHLKANLAEAAVPAHLVALPALPLTPNGKLDRAALPDPEPAAGARSAPRDGVEERLVAIWREVLGRDDVGVTDNFFALGGDSILSLQIIARARRVGLKITPKQLFEAQTIAALAPLAQAVEPKAPARPRRAAAGQAVELTPVQLGFFAADIPNRNHWNQAVLLNVPAALDTTALAAALGAVVARHGALRLRFSRDGQGGWRARVGEAPAGADLLWERQVAAPHEAAALYEAAQRSLDIAEGPLLRALHVRLPDAGGRLLIAIHHLAVDGVSWRVLLEELQQAYAQHRAGASVDLPSPGSAFADWTARLATWGREPARAAELPYWQAQLSPHGLAELPRDRVGATGDNGDTMRERDAGRVRVKLDRAATTRLLGAAPQAYRTEVNDLLLAALADVLCAAGGASSVLIQLEGHGREDLFPELDLSRTVGWFTSLFPVRIDLPPVPARTPGAVIKAVKEQLRAVPARGIGAGVLRAFNPEARASLEAGALPCVTFNYLGQFDRHFGGEGLFTPADESPGAMRDPDGPLGNALVIDGEVYDGELRLAFTFARAMFDEATIAALAERYLATLGDLVEHCVDGAAGGLSPSDVPLCAATQAELDALPVPARQIEDVYPLSHLQHGLFFHSREGGAADLYVNQLVVDVDGLDPARFAAVWAGLVARHAMLRTGFVWTGARALQVVHRQVPAPVRVEDGSGRDAAALAALARAELDRGFCLDAPSLQRLVIVRRAGGACRLIWTHHHLLTDGWSSARLMDEALASYFGEAVPPALPYRDYVAWLADRDRQGDAVFWQACLGDLGGPTLLAEALAADPRWRPRPGEGPDQLQVRLDAGATARLAAFAQAARVTTGTMIEAALTLLARALAGTPRAAFGLTVAGRPAELAGAEHMLGLFINTLPLASDAPPHLAVGDWLRELQAAVTRLQEHDQTPLADIQRWAGHPGEALFDTILVFENYPVDAALRARCSGRLRFGTAQVHGRNSFALTIVAEPGETLDLTFRFDGARIGRAGAGEVVRRLLVLLEALSADAVRPVGAVPLLADGEQALEVPDAGGPRSGADVLERFAAHVRAAPRSCAVRGPDGDLPMATLDARAEAVAAALRRLGVGPEVPVAVTLERSVDLVVALLGILKAGGIYVPLDPGAPAAWRAQVVATHAIRHLIAQDEARVEVESAAPLPLTLATLLGEGQSAPGVDPNDPAKAAAGPAGAMAAYMVFTSGSTGTPKGVVVPRHAIGAYAEEMAAVFARHRVGSIAMVSTPAADLGHTALFGALAAGITLHPVSREVASDPAAFAAQMAAQPVDALKITPSHLAGLAAAAGLAAVLPRLLLVLGGEPCPADLVARIAAVAPHCVVINHYGPTETTVGTAMGEAVAEAGGGVPIGRAFPYARLHVLDRDLRPVPAGVVGELYVGGSALARGYQGDSAATAARFVPDPFASAPGARLYRTGDRVRRRADGTLAFAGRADAQVKVRGFRVEPGEVEARLRQIPGVGAAVVRARRGAAGPSLIAYLTLDPDAAVTPATARAALRRVLPEHMVPAAFVVLEHLPLTPNGKIDDRALPEPERDGGGHLPPEGAREEMLAAIWRDLLGCGAVGAGDDFFALGGDSLLAMQMLGRVRQAGFELSFRQLLAAPTLRALAAEMMDEGPDLAAMAATAAAILDEFL